MNAVKRLLWVDFVLSLAAAWYFFVPSASAAQYGLCTESQLSATCALAILNMQLFYGKSLAHSVCILAAALSREPRTVALVSSGVCVWCWTMAALLWRAGYAPQTQAAIGGVVLFGTLYALLLGRWWWQSRRVAATP